MSKLSTIICLDHLRCLAEVNDCPPCKVYGRVTASLIVGINETLSGRLVDHGILVKLFSACASIAGRRNVLYILPFNTKVSRRVIAAIAFGGGFHLCTVSQLDKYQVERASVASVCLLLTQLSVHLTDADVWIVPM